MGTKGKDPENTYPVTPAVSKLIKDALPRGKQAEMARDLKIPQRAISDIKDGTVLSSKYLMIILEWLQIPPFYALPLDEKQMSWLECLHALRAAKDAEQIDVVTSDLAQRKRRATPAEHDAMALNRHRIKKQRKP